MSEPRTPVTGEPVDVHDQRAKEAKAKAEKAVKEKVVEAAEQLGKIVRGTIGPPGTP